MSIPLLAYLLFSWIRIIFLFPVNPDGGCYLSVTERLSDGLRPYVDISMNYPPVSYYYYLIFRELIGGGDIIYRFALLTIEAASSFVLALITKRLFKSTVVSVFSGILFLFFYLAYDGPWFVMEPFVNLFSLAAVFFLLNSSKAGALASGACLLLSVMSKQYGVLVLPSLLLLIFRKQDGFDVKTGLLRGLLLCGGFLLTALVMFQLLHIDVAIFISKISGHGYEKEGILKMLSALFSTRGLWFIVVLILPVVVLLRKFDFNLFIFTFLCLCHTAPLYVRTYPHYFQLLLPYGIILLIYAAVKFFFEETSTGNFKKVTAAALILTLTGPAAAALYVPARYAMSFKDKREIAVTAQKINTVVGQRSAALVINEPQFWYLCNLYPPTHEEGYHVVYKSGDYGNPFKYNMADIPFVLWFDGDTIALDDPQLTGYLMLTHKKTAVLHFHGGKRTVEIWDRK
ncbi:MAG: hypothetical protein H7844_03280 [Nitrospirae bacterium YQR-1]